MLLHTFPAGLVRGLAAGRVELQAGQAVQHDVGALGVESNDAGSLQVDDYAAAHINRRLQLLNVWDS